MDVSQLLQKLCKLQRLVLSGCKKLTPNFGEIFSQLEAAGSMANTDISKQSRQRSCLQTLNVQRCFQLNSSTLTQLIHAAATGNMPLKSLAMSHLDLSSWPSAERKAAAANSDNSIALTSFHDMLVSCFSSRLTTPGQAQDYGGTASYKCNIQVLALNNCTRLTATSLQAIAETCPRLEYLFLGGSSMALGSGYAVPWGMTSMYTQLVETAHRTVLRTSKPPLGMSAMLANLHHEAATSLVTMVLSMPNLKALELTCMHPYAVACVKSALAHVCEDSGRPTVAIWDLALGGSVAAAAAALRAASQEGAPWAHSGLSMALRCAVNCSSGTRCTPLHASCERGDAATARSLLSLGTQVNARDTAGATALFLACEAGNTLAVEVLLASGADPNISNAAGECPLYIAALRGHIGVVRAILRHCTKNGVQWQEPKLYGDCWTPLMAAAVADRHDVALCLLMAAGLPGARKLVNAVNRYGQSVMHIAARKGSQKLLQLLLSFGGHASIGAADTSGDTPVDVAKKNRHEVALVEFMRATTVA